MFASLKDLLESLVSLSFYPATGLETGFMSAPVRTLLLCCLVVFLETGLIFFPFLPGDVFLILCGTVMRSIGYGLMWPSFFISTAAFLGTQMNYALGYYFGSSIESYFGATSLYGRHIEKAKPFMKKYGILSVVLSRWCGWLRTFVPFISGIFALPFKKFTICSLLSAFLWVYTFIFFGAHTPIWMKEYIGAFMLAGVVATPLASLLYLLYSLFSKAKPILSEEGKD